jgi:hypothetical protein
LNPYVLLPLSNQVHSYRECTVYKQQQLRFDVAFAVCVRRRCTTRDALVLQC